MKEIVRREGGVDGGGVTDRRGVLGLVLHVLLGLSVGGVRFSGSCNLSGGSGSGLACGVHCGMSGPSHFSAGPGSVVV